MIIEINLYCYYIVNIFNKMVEYNYDIYLTEVFMNSVERRKYIEEVLIKSDSAQKGNDLAHELSVTRQIIVKDIAILRAEGKKIIATPDGYIVPSEQKCYIKRVVALSHNAEQIQDELEIIVKFGGIIEDVIIEHPIYGEIRGMLMIKTLFGIQNFIEKVKSNNAEPLSMLTGGVHLHTLVVENEDILDKILTELKKKGYLIS